MEEYIKKSVLIEEFTRRQQAWEAATEINWDSAVVYELAHEYKGMARAYKNACATIELMSPADVTEAKHEEWISCDERLPDKKGEYLVSYHPCYWDFVDKKVMVGVDTFLGKTKWAKKKYQRVIAWMPKPKPYVERKEADGTSI